MQNVRVVYGSEASDIQGAMDKSFKWRKNENKFNISF